MHLNLTQTNRISGLQLHRKVIIHKKICFQNLSNVRAGSFFPLTHLNLSSFT